MKQIFPEGTPKLVRLQFPTFTKLLADVLGGDVVQKVVGAGIPEHAQGVHNVLDYAWKHRIIPLLGSLPQLGLQVCVLVDV